MLKFLALWTIHPGLGDVCDKRVFENQCAMRVGHALRVMRVSLRGLKTCVDYDRRKFTGHNPGHVRSAQDLANHFYRRPKAHGLGADSFKIFTGPMMSHMDVLKHKVGMIFIKNGWGATDHIDFWKGDGVRAGKLKGGHDSFFQVGEQVWLWDFGTVAARPSRQVVSSAG